MLTGANGFIGSHLKTELQRYNYAVATPIFPEFDLTKPKTIRKAVTEKPYDVVVHLAAISHVMECEKDPDLAHQINVDGTVELLRTISEENPKCHFIFASTAQVYAAPQGDEIREGVTFDESRAIKPQNAYAETKWQAEKEIRTICALTHMSATILRLFNHTHKSQSTGAFLPYIYQELLKGKQSKKEVKIPIGNINVSRDVGAVQDLITAFSRFLRDHTPSVETYNVCTGQARNMGDLAIRLAKHMEVRMKFVTDPARVRAYEAVSIQGSYEKLRLATGWQPSVKTDDELIEKFLADTF